MRRRTKRQDSLDSKDTFHVIGPAGELAVTGYGPQVGLTMAQEQALRAFTAPAVLTVERQSLFGPRTPIYRVIRDEEGTISSFTLEQ